MQVNTGAVASAPTISAGVTPSTSALVHGQTLEETEGWSDYIAVSNYASIVPGETILSVEISFVGSVPDATVPLSDGDLNQFSVTVTGTSGSQRTFLTQARTVLHIAPGTGSLAPVSQAQGSGPITRNLAAAFTGQDLTFAVSAGWATVVGDLLTIADVPRTDTLVVTATNSGGSASINLPVEITSVASGAAVINSVTAGPISISSMPIDIAASATGIGDNVYWVLVSSLEPVPSATEIVAGTGSGGTTPVDAGSLNWPALSDGQLSSGILRDDYIVYAVIDNGVLSNVGVSAPIQISTAAPILSGITASVLGDDIQWGATSNEPFGVIHAALRADFDIPLSADDIIAGNGAAIAVNTDSSPSAGASYGGVFVAPGEGTFIVDIVQVDDFGNVSNPISSNSVTIGTVVPESQQSLTYLNDSDTYANTGSPVTVDMSAAATNDWLLIGVTQASGGGADIAFDGVTLEGAAATFLPGASITDTFRKAAIWKVQCPAAAASNPSAQAIATVSNGDLTGRYNLFVYQCASEPTVIQVATDRNVTMDVSLVQTVADNPVVVFAAAASDQITINGVPEEGSAVVLGGRRHVCGSDANATGGTRTLTVTTTTGNAVAISAEIGTNS